MSLGRDLIFKTLPFFMVTCLWFAPIALANEFEQFGIEAVEAEESTTVAGAHPDFTTKLVLNHYFKGDRAIASARVQEARVSLPPGLAGYPAKFPTCGMGEFNAMGNCPVGSQVGVVRMVTNESKLSEEAVVPLFNLELPHPEQEIAKLGFFVAIFPITIDISVRTASDYGITATVRNATGLAPLISAKTVLWGVPAAPSHDELRLTTEESLVCQTACKAPEGKRSSGLPERPFLNNPSACQPMKVDFAVASYQLPGQVFGASAPMAPITECQSLGFDPTLEVEPTNPTAGAPTGLRATLHIPQSENPSDSAISTMRTAKVTLPEGMVINPAAANGLEACSNEQVGLGTEGVSACPDASKLGTARIVSPSLHDAIHGAIYQRSPAPGRPFRLWLVIDDVGLHAKLPGEILADKNTGRLIAEFRDLPQLPVEDIEMEIWGGDRAPLKNPDTCGTYTTRYELSPWSGNPPAAADSAMTINRGCGARSFDPRIEAGVTDPTAGAFTSFVLKLFRLDAEEHLASFTIDLPKGLLAKLAGVPLCPEDSAPRGACPTESQIGSVIASVGAGPDPLWVPQPGKASTAVYLAGPYKSAPYSIITRVPAQAGPFDLGNVVVRSALRVNPETGQASIQTDPLPQFVEGAAALYRTLYVAIDRPRFVINPTSCEEKAFRSTITSTLGTTARPGFPFRVRGCRDLGFQPQLSLRLRGGTERGDYPALNAVLTTRKGDANLRRVSVALPHSEFLAQEHIRTICTRVQYAADKCPKNSVYGYAKAWTPLLDRPLEGPVYLRSSDHPLPDLVAALDGQIDIDLAGRIDSINGGIRTIFSPLPDAPVTRFVLRMKGGRRGLLVNSRYICRNPGRAIVQMDGQNGRLRDSITKPQHRGCGNKKLK